jgi:hypothetical protein
MSTEEMAELMVDFYNGGCMLEIVAWSNSPTAGLQLTRCTRTTLSSAGTPRRSGKP